MSRPPRNIPFYLPLTDREEIAEVSGSIRSGWLTSGPKVALFEKRLGRLVGAPHAIAVNSCTAALHLALIAAGVERGDEVITSPYTFVATGEAILYLGARPVFADIDPETLNIDPESVARAVTRKTRALLPVHVAGLPCSMGPLAALARKHRLRLIDDAAHALGAAYKGRPIGSVADMTCFSFYATKNLTTGEGGMVTLSDSRAAARIRRMRLHGLTSDSWSRHTGARAWNYRIADLGYKYNMTDLAAGVGLAQLRRFRSMQKRRRALAARYTKLLGSCDAFDLPPERSESDHAWHLYILRLRRGVLRISRNDLIDRLGSRGIGTSVHFIPLHRHPYYRKAFGYRAGSFPCAERESARAVTLPLYPALSDAAQSRVIGALLDLAARHRR